MNIIDQIYTLKAVSSGDAGWLAAFFTWIGVARFVLKVINKWLEDFFTGIISNFPDSHPVKIWASRLTSSTTYTFIHWLINWVTSISLPKYENIKKSDA